LSRENAQAKGRRYIGEGRLVISELDEDAGVVQADCRGDGAIWTLGHDERGWWCSCPALGRCAHLYALGLVTALEPRKETA
jgi:hypothetical protein